MKMKWDINGKGVAPTAGGSGGNYSGPPLPKGSWPAKIKRITVGQIKSGANAGKPRLSVLLEVQTAGIEGKEQYNGAPVWDGLNIMPSGIGYTNAFLHALTDGSESAKRAIESAFWDSDKGPDIKKVQNKSGVDETHIIKIGKVKIDSPNGNMMVQITTKVEKDLSGNDRPGVASYMPHKSTIEGANNVAADDDLDDEDDEVDVDDDDDFDDDDDMLDDAVSAKPF
jgi:hypothetical protein